MGADEGLVASPGAVAWDTTSAARLRPDSAAHELALTQWRAADPMAVTATTLMEIKYGLAKLAKVKPAAAVQRDWLQAEIDAGVVVVLDFNERAASITGALRAAQPAPPTNRPATEGPPRPTTAWRGSAIFRPPRPPTRTATRWRPPMPITWPSSRCWPRSRRARPHWTSSPRPSEPAAPAGPA